MEKNRWTFGKLKNLPKSSGIYWVFSMYDELLYIGSSKNINRRWKNHHILKGLQEQYKGFHICCDLIDEDKIHQEEKELIKKHNPRLNWHCEGFEKDFGKGTVIKIPDELVELVDKIQIQACNKGYRITKTEAMRIIAKNYTK